MHTPNGANGYAHTNGMGSSDSKASNGANGHSASNGSYAPLELELDALIVGAGFAGVYLLHRLRQEGYNIKIAEAGTAIGGVWHWNCYPGARVDSQYPIYALSIPEVYKTWQWKQQYPGEKELKQYFEHVGKVLDVSRDTLFGTTVLTAVFDESTDKWRIGCENGTRITCRYFLSCIGFAAKRHYPDFKGLDSFKGYMCHSSFWPHEGVDVKGKKVAVIGTGATGIQIAQETAKEASHLTCFVRTPNHCIPMQQGHVDSEQQVKDLATIHDRLTKKRFESLGGMLYPDAAKNVFDDSPEERRATLEEAWRLGGFRLTSAYKDVLTSEAANAEVYKFWVEKRRAQMTDPVKRDLLAPEEAVHFIFGKRPSLEQDYYEQMDKPHVTLVNVKTNPVSHVVSNGIVTADGILHEIDILAIATGFDAVVGGYKHLDITGLHGETLKTHWEKGVYTYLGMTVANFPNLMYTYGPHSPTAYANGPSIVEPQAEWIVSVMNKMREEGKTRITAKVEAEREWKEEIRRLHSTSLRDRIDGWYNGTNIPGNVKQPLNYNGGIPLYLKTIRATLDDFDGFEVR
ncbi:hypothetical protein LTR95_004256 [Oleoguttula sp. CCFEE 5521]